MIVEGLSKRNTLLFYIAYREFIELVALRGSTVKNITLVKMVSVVSCTIDFKIYCIKFKGNPYYVWFSYNLMEHLFLAAEHFKYVLFCST